MKTVLLVAQTQSPDLSAVSLFIGIIFLFWAVAIAVRLGTLAKESKKQTEFLRVIAAEYKRKEMLLMKERARAAREQD